MYRTDIEEIPQIVKQILVRESDYFNSTDDFISLTDMPSASFYQCKAFEELQVEAHSFPDFWIVTSKTNEEDVVYVIFNERLSFYESNTFKSIIPQSFFLDSFTSRDIHYSLNEFHSIYEIY